AVRPARRAEAPQVEHCGHREQREHRGPHPDGVLLATTPQRVETRTRTRGGLDDDDVVEGNVDVNGGRHHGAGHGSIPWLADRRRDHRRHTVASAYVTPMAPSSAASPPPRISTRTSAALVNARDAAYTANATRQFGRRERAVKRACAHVFARNVADTAKA